MLRIEWFSMECNIHIGSLISAVDGLPPLIIGRDTRNLHMTFVGAAEVI